jgi:dihydrofolate reductase
VRKVQLYVAQSFDGFIADRDGGVSWLEPFEGRAEDHGYAAFIAEVGAVVMGATTYEQVLGFGWPYAERPAFVFTHRDLPVPEQADVRFVDGAVRDVLPALDAATEKNVFLVGGANLVRQFLEGDAIDELHLFIAPVLLGEGIPLFDRAPRRDFQLRGTETYSTGIAALRYARSL